MPPARTTRVLGRSGLGDLDRPAWRVAKANQIRVGISGWTYPPWRGTFYPKGVRQEDELAFASRKVSSIEVNGTFYSLQSPDSYRSWYERTPVGFVFSLKGPRFITHIRRLNEPKAPLANFFASGPLWLKEKLGPILWQLPPGFVFEPDRLERFFLALPRTSAEATTLAKKHDSHAKQFGWPSRLPERRLRHALEVRHPSFLADAFIRMLVRHKIALVVADTAGKWPAMENVTADFVYVRLHGDAELYVSGYTNSALGEWAAKIEAWSVGDSVPNPRILGRIRAPRRRKRDVFAYFDNDVKVRAPFDAMNLAHRLGIGEASPPFAPTLSHAEPVRSRWPGFPTRRGPRTTKPAVGK